MIALEILLPRIGLFWVTPDRAGAWDIRDVAKSEAEVPSIGGFRTLDVGHVDVWQGIGGYLTRDYGVYPRGRVNWRAEDDRYLLLLDPILLRDGWSGRIAAKFHLPADRTLLMTDAHYRSNRRPPAVSKVSE